MMGLLVYLVCLEKWVLEAFLDLEDFLDFLGLLAYLVLKATKVRRETRALQVLQDHLVKLVARDPSDPL